MGQIEDMLNQWRSEVLKDTGVPDDLIDENSEIDSRGWIRCIITDKDGNMKEMYDQHISEINLPEDIMQQIRNQDKDSMCFMVVQTDEDDHVLNAKILLNCVPISCNTCNNSKSVENKENIDENKTD